MFTINAKWSRMRNAAYYLVGVPVGYLIWEIAPWFMIWATVVHMLCVKIIKFGGGE